MPEIIPAIMPESFKDLEIKMRQVRNLVSIVQLDVMDGIFTPPITWPYNLKEGFNFEDILKGKKDMPFLKDLEFEVDLMVSHPEEEVERWIRVGARRVVGHFEALEDPEAFIKKAKDATVPYDSPLYAEVGLAIGIETDIEDISSLVSELDFVQVMGITRIGFQGEEFQEETVETVSLLRQSFPELVISVDGGVNEDNAYFLTKAGADRLVSGSAVFQAGDIKEAVENLRSSGGVV